METFVFCCHNAFLKYMNQKADFSNDITGSRPTANVKGQSKVILGQRPHLYHLGKSNPRRGEQDTKVSRFSLTVCHLTGLTLICLFVWGFTLLSTLYRSYHDG